MPRWREQALKTEKNRFRALRDILKFPFVFGISFGPYAGFKLSSFRLPTEPWEPRLNLVWANMISYEVGPTERKVEPNVLFQRALTVTTTTYLLYNSMLLPEQGYYSWCRKLEPPPKLYHVLEEVIALRLLPDVCLAYKAHDTSGKDGTANTMADVVHILLLR